MIGLLHGYLLEGSGSNLWTRSVIDALCRTGETVHLVCQDPHPELYDFIATVYDYPLDGSVRERFTRDVPYPGRCIMHKPALGETLPVYVWDEYEEFTRVVPMVHLDDHEIEAYLARNTEVVRRVVQDHGITVLQANHTVLMSVVAQRIGEELGVPYVVMPHGSALEYAVKPDARFHRYASSALAAAERVLVSADELRERVLSVFPALPDLETRITEIRVGVDTGGFRPIERSERPGNIETVAGLLRGDEGGGSLALQQELEEALARATTPAAVHHALALAARYDGKQPDRDAAAKLRAIDWEADAVILFVGRIIVAKGVHCLVAALPEILEQQPRARLVIAGHGPLREPLEALLYALRTGDRALADRLATGDAGEDRLATEPMTGVLEYWQALERDGRLDAYWESAALLQEDTATFIGYMTHHELRWIFPCCDVGVFPSIVKESGPMVFLEALSSGCFPVGTYHAGTAQKIDAVAPYLEDADAEWMKVRPEPAHLAGDLARAIPGALDVAARYRRVLREVAEREYDWKPIAARLARTLHDISARSGTRTR